MHKNYIAVLGDLHGHITLAYRLLRRWEIESGQALSAILQVGDFGAFPPPFRVDDTTMRFYKRDPDELGFVHYYEGSDEAAEILSEEIFSNRRLGAHLYFIKGNHEDFEYLEGLPHYSNSPVPVDAYQKIYYVASGDVISVHLGPHKLSIAALGGIACNDFGEGAASSAYYTNSEYRRLCAWHQDIDIFLSHDAPFGKVIDDAGSREVLLFIQAYRPKLHFCGHYHVDGRQLDVPDSTRSFVLNEVNFRKPSKLNRGCIGMVEVDRNGNLDAYILEEGWLKEYNRNNFRTL